MEKNSRKKKTMRRMTRAGGRKTRGWITGREDQEENHWRIGTCRMRRRRSWNKRNVLVKDAGMEKLEQQEEISKRK